MFLRSAQCIGIKLNVRWWTDESRPFILHLLDCLEIAESSITNGWEWISHLSLMSLWSRWGSVSALAFVHPAGKRQFSLYTTATCSEKVFIMCFLMKRGHHLIGHNKNALNSCQLPVVFCCNLHNWCTWILESNLFSRWSVISALLL